MPQVALELQPVERITVHVGLEPFCPAFAAAFGRVHRHVRVSQQLRRRRARLSDGDAVLFTGHGPEGMRRFCIGFYRWATRVQGYQLLVIDEYPPFSFDA